MTKPFLTYEQQLHKLIAEKHLIINDINFAKQKLCDIGYFSFVSPDFSRFNRLPRV